jgi:hypothetical protein
VIISQALYPSCFLISGQSTPGTSFINSRSFVVQVTGCFKTQIDWLPLNTGSVRPTQGRTVMVAQVMSPYYQSDRMDECISACGSLIEFRLIDISLIDISLIEFRLNSIKLSQALIEFSPQEVEFDLGALVTFD